MKHIYLNLKRFDVLPEYGGVNRLAPMQDWAAYILANTQEALRTYASEAEFAMFFPELHLLAAAAAKTPDSPVLIGCQGVYRQDVDPGGNFGAFTCQRPAAAMRQAGCDIALIGHCEERKDQMGILAEAGIADTDAVNRLLNQEIRCALQRGMKVVYCVGENSEEQSTWETVLRRQLRIGLKDTDLSGIVIAYEPVWSIGPGKTPADRDYIRKIARFIKEETGGADVVYGGGLKRENAEMLASIPEVDGGLIALTRFTGEIGFAPGEYLEIVRRYLGEKTC